MCTAAFLGFLFFSSSSGAFEDSLQQLVPAFEYYRKAVAYGIQCSLKTVKTASLLADDNIHKRHFGVEI